VHVAHLPSSPGLPLPDERAGVVYVPLWGTGGAVIAGEAQPTREATLDGRSGAVIAGEAQPTREATLDGRSGALLHIGPPGRMYVSSDAEIPVDSWGWMPSGLRQLIPFIPPPPQERRRPYELRFSALSSEPK
jgi:hypothetical protein